MNSTQPSMQCPTVVRIGAWATFCLSVVGIVLAFMALTTPRPFDSLLPAADIVLFWLAIVEGIARCVLAVLTMMGRAWAYYTLLVLVGLGLLLGFVIHSGLVGLTLIIFILLLAGFRRFAETNSEPIEDFPLDEQFPA